MNDQKPIKVTPAHLIRALCGIENWIKGIRKVLLQMDQNQEIELSRHLPGWDWIAYSGSGGGGNVPTIKGCPPPDIYEGIEVKGCPPPDWYQEDCPDS
jgi:hypothetical protein